MLFGGETEGCRDGPRQIGDRLRPPLQRTQQCAGGRIEQVRAARGLVVDDGLALPAAPPKRRGVERVEEAAAGVVRRGGYGGGDTLPESAPEVVVCFFANAVPCSVRMIGTPRRAALLMIRRRCRIPCSIGDPAPCCALASSRCRSMFPHCSLDVSVSSRHRCGGCLDPFHVLRRAGYAVVRRRATGQWGSGEDPCSWNWTFWGPSPAARAMGPEGPEAFARCAGYGP